LGDPLQLLPVPLWIDFGGEDLQRRTLGGDSLGEEPGGFWPGGSGGLVTKGIGEVVLGLGPFLRQRFAGPDSRVRISSAAR